MKTQRDHIYLNNNLPEIFIVEKILEKYGFDLKPSKPDENNIISCIITGKNDKQDLSVLTNCICQILDIINPYIHNLEMPTYCGGCGYTHKVSEPCPADWDKRA